MAEEEVICFHDNQRLLALVAELAEAAGRSVQEQVEQMARDELLDRTRPKPTMGTVTPFRARASKSPLKK